MSISLQEDLTETVVYIGTHKIVALEGILHKGDPRVLRHATMKNPSGFDKGLVTSLEEAASSIEKLLEGLHGGQIPEDLAVYVVLGNSKLKTYSFSSSQYFQGFQRTISSVEIRSVVSQTRSVATIPLSEFVLQAIPESFIVNDTENVTNPLGLEAHRLGVNLKIFTMNFQDFKNVSRAFETAEIEVKGYFPKTLSASDAVLSDQEKEDGVLLIDIADETCHLALWKGRYLINTKVVDAGGRKLTAKIASEWEIQMSDAEKLKERFASFETQSQFGEELIPLVERNGNGNHQARRQDFQEKFLANGEAWMRGLLSQADEFAKENRVYHPHLVFTGGGTSVEHFLEFLQKNFSRNARIGLAKKIDAPTELAVDPSLTGALGMMKWLSVNVGEQKRLFAPKGFLQKTFSSAREWFAAYF